MIPVIDANALATGEADAAIGDAATRSGFLTLANLSDAGRLAADRATLCSFFGEGESIRHPVLRHKFAPGNPSVYRGHFPAAAGEGQGTEGYDIGPDLAFPSRASNGDDPLTEPTPVPDIPGWRDAAARYHASLETLGQQVVRALLRAIGADPARADALFADSISTLRLFSYPALSGPIPDDRRVETPRGPRRVMAGAHTDSGFVTLLWQGAAGGLQARELSGDWIDVPPAPDGLVVNFGQLLADWSGGRIRATEHRVIGGHAERLSVPYFFEPGAYARIEPLFPGDAFETVVYGDFLWNRIGRFPAFRGVERRRAAMA